MTEATLKSALVKVIPEVMPGAVVQRHEDIFRKGGPDMSVTWNKMTSWWEVKYANPGFKSTGVQKLTCQRLAEQGHCFYIIYVENEKNVVIQDAKNLSEWMSSGFVIEGFNHKGVASFMYGQHWRQDR